MSQDFYSEVSGSADAMANPALVRMHYQLTTYLHRDLLVRHQKSLHARNGPSEPVRSGEMTQAEQQWQPNLVKQNVGAPVMMNINNDGPRSERISYQPQEADSSLNEEVQESSGNLASADFQNEEVQGLSQSTELCADIMMTPAMDSFAHAAGTLICHQESPLPSLENGPFESAMDVHFSESDWIDCFDCSTTTYSSVFRTTQPLWPAANISLDPLLQLQDNPKPFTDNFDTTLPTPGSVYNKKFQSHSLDPKVSLLDRIFSRRSTPEPRPSAPLGPISQINSGIRGRLVSKLKAFSHLLPNRFALPSHRALSRYTSVYFDRGQHHLPFIHVPTWSPESCNLGLFLAICAMGAGYCFERGTSLQLWKAGKAIVGAKMEECSDKIREEIKVADGDDELKGSEDLIELTEICQAMLLLMIFATWAGDKNLLRQALSFQSGLAAVGHLTV